MSATAYYRIGQYYVDDSTPTAPVLYRCTTAGDKTTSVWAAISGGGGGGGGIKPFKIKSDGGDYWIARTWDGSTEGSLDVYILKEYQLRAGANAITSAVIRGVTYTFTYSPVYITGTSGAVAYYTQQRTGSDTSVGLAYCIPDPVVFDASGNPIGAIIYADEPETIDITIPTSLASVIINDGGSGYVSGDVGQVLTVAGGTGTSATLTIASVAAGKVTGVTLTTGGKYTINPSLTANAATGATTGTGATFDLTLSPTLMDTNRASRAWTVQ